MLIPLDAPQALDREIAGGKAARLAAVRGAGLPVAPGWIVPAWVSARAAAKGAVALGRSGHAAARLAVSSVEVDEALVAAIEERAASLGGRVVVRSSFAEEDDPRWSGAFASYLDVRPGDLAVALRGCWASLFSRDVEARCERLERRPSELRMAALVQPRLDLRSGGLARIGADGRVVVSSVPASPAGLMGGRRTGTVAEIDPGALPGSDGEGDLRPIAHLATAVRDATGHDTIEWGITTSGVAIVLQASTAGAVEPPRAPARAPGDVPRAAARIASAAMRFPGPLGEELVLTWAIATGAPPNPLPVRVSDAVRAFAEVRRASARLAAEVWGLAAPDAIRTARETFASLRGADPAGRNDASDRIDGLHPIDDAPGAAILATLAGIARELERSAALASAELMWHVQPAELERALARGERPRIAAGPDRWEPLLVDVVAAHGETLRGEPVSPGAGAGAIRTIGPRWYADPPARRRVLVTAYPSPHLAPLLWGCAGLATSEGSLGAHLFEVARALGVPAVTGVSLPAGARRDGTIVTVDGDAGTVGALTAATATGARERTFGPVGGRP